MNKTTAANTSMVGGSRSDAQTNGYGWTLISEDQVTASSGTMSIRETDEAVTMFAVGPYSSTVTTDADYGDLVSQWWLAAGYTQRAVSL
jgi:hypothetical protein